MSEQSSNGSFWRKARKEKKKKSDRKWNILDILHLGPLKISRKKSKSVPRSMSQEPINSKEKIAPPKAAPSSEYSTAPVSAKEVLSSASPSKRTTVREHKPPEYEQQEKSVSLRSSCSPEPKKTATRSVVETSREVIGRMPVDVEDKSGYVNPNPKSEDAHSAKEPTRDDDNDENMRKIDKIEGEMRECEIQLKSTKLQSRELIKRLDTMNKDIDALDFLLAKVEATLEAKIETQETALDQLEKTQFQQIRDAAEHIDKIEDVSKDVNFQVDEMTSDAEELLWYLYNPIHATVDLFLHVVITLILWVFNAIAALAGYQFETSEDSMDAVIDVEYHPDDANVAKRKSVRSTTKFKVTK